MHRTPEAVNACHLRLQRKQEREARKAEDTERRRLFAEAIPPTVFIRNWEMRGGSLLGILAALNKNYPPPEGKPCWDWEEYNKVRLPPPEYGMHGEVKFFPHDYHKQPLVAAYGDSAGQVVCRRCIQDLWGDE